MDMGECNRVHDLALRADFENAQKKKVGTIYILDLDLVWRIHFICLNIHAVGRGEGVGIHMVNLICIYLLMMFKPRLKMGFLKYPFEFVCACCEILSYFIVKNCYQMFLLEPIKVKYTIGIMTQICFCIPEIFKTNV